MKKIFLILALLLINSTAFAVTKAVVPRANGEGSIGTSSKNWGNIYSSSAVIGGQSVCLADGTNCPSGVGATAYDDIGDPDATSAINMGAFNSTWTSSTGTNLWTSAATVDGFKIVNTSTYGASGSVLKLSQTGNTTGGSVLMIENTDADSKSIQANNFAVTQAGNVSMAGDLTVSGDDLFMADNTSGKILIADGTNYNPTAVSGDITLSSTGDAQLGTGVVGATELASTSVIAGSYTATDLTVDADGRITAASNGSGGSTPRLDQISDPNTNVDFVMNANNSVWTSTTGTHLWTAAATTANYFTIANSGVLASGGSLLRLNQSKSANPTGGSVISIENYDTDVNHISAPNFTVTQSGNLTIGGAVTANGSGASSTSGALTIGGDLTISSGGSGIISTSNTSGNILVANGTKFVPVAMSGSCTIASGGSITCSGGGGSTTSLDLNHVTDPTGNSGLNFGSFTNTWTSSTGSHVWTSSATTQNYFTIHGEQLTTGDALTVQCDGSMTTGNCLKILGGTSGTTTILAVDDTNIKTNLTASQFVKTDSSGNLTTVSSSATTNAVVQLPPYSAKLTGGFITTAITNLDSATQSAQIDAGDGNWRVLFDATTDESIIYQFVIPNNYSSTPLLKIQYSMASATSSTVEWEGAIMCVTPGDSADINTASFANGATTSETVPGTAGYESQVTISLTDDSCAAGDTAIIYISTDANDGTNDAATGDRELINAWFTYTTL